MEKELFEKKNDLIVRAEETLNKAKAEKRELTDAEMAELAEIRDNVRRILKTLSIKKDFEEMEEGKKPVEKVEIEKEVEERALEEEKDFEAFIRNTYNERANNMTFTDNGAVIPTTIADRIIKKVYDICPILERSSKYNVKGKLEIPYYDESTTAINVAYATEFNELDSNVGKFTSIELDGYLAGALSLISRSLINNAKFDIVGFVVDEIAYHVSRFIEGELLNGTATKVEGLSGVTNTLTTASSSAIVAEELIALQGQIKDIYQNNAIWVMSPNTRTALRQLKDEVGRFLLQDDITAPFGHTLLGKPVYVSDNMADITAGEVAIFYGDMKGLATKFSETLNIQVLREKYATQHAIGVVAWLEFDAKVENQQQLSALVMHS